MLKLFLILIFSFNFLFPQSNSFLTSQKDTSYTLYSAAKKIHRKFPDAVLITSNFPTGINEKQNIIYSSYNNRDLHLNVFYPENNNKLLPVILMIHGGGWRSGDPSMLFPMAEKLAENGYVAICAEYRLSTEAIYPAAVIDLNNAVKWIESNSRKYNIDKNKIAVYGCSAGGQLASLIGVKLNDSGNIKAIINVDGIVDFLDPESEEKDKPDGSPGAAHMWFGANQFENPLLWKDASPINYVNKKTPPILFINSSIPRFHAGANRMIEKLNAFYIYNEMHTLEGTPHTFWLFSPWFEETLNYTVKFLNKILKRNENEIN